MWIKRFAINWKKNKVKRVTFNSISYTSCIYHPVICDRKQNKDIVEVNTGDNDLDEKIINSILADINKKYGKDL